jgi:hypothetical protein
LEQNLLVIGIELSHGKAAAAGEPAERIREPNGRPERLSKESRYPLLAAIIRSRSSRASARTSAVFGSTKALSNFERTVLAEPCSPEIASNG